MLKNDKTLSYNCTPGDTAKCIRFCHVVIETYLHITVLTYYKSFYNQAEISRA